MEAIAGDEAIQVVINIEIEVLRAHCSSRVARKLFEQRVMI